MCLLYSLIRNYFSIQNTGRFVIWREPKVVSKSCGGLLQPKYKARQWSRRNEDEGTQCWRFHECSCFTRRCENYYRENFWSNKISLKPKNSAHLLVLTSCFTVECIARKCRSTRDDFCLSMYTCTLSNAYSDILNQPVDKYMYEKTPFVRQC